jgi:hypothetical protein
MGRKSMWSFKQKDGTHFILASVEKTLQEVEGKGRT